MVFVLLINSATAQLADSPWPKFRGNLKNTGLSPYDTSHLDGTVEWIFETKDEFEGSLSIGIDGTLYIGSHNNIFYALNPDGTEKWRFKAGEPVFTEQHEDWKGVLSTPAIAKDGTIYFTSLSNYLFALNSDGTEKWRYNIKTTGDIWSSPVIDKDGTIYVGAANELGYTADGKEIIEPIDESMNGLFAINPDGTLKWKFKNMGDMFPTAAIGDDGTIYIGAADGDAMVGKVYAITPDGKEKWHFKSKMHIESSVALGKDGTVYFGSWDDYFYALDSNGKEKWKYKTGGDGIVSTPAIGADGTIYFAGNDGYFYAFNPDGKLKWKVHIGGGKELGCSPAIGADGTIYFASSWNNEKSTFFAFNPDGTIKWDYDIGGSSSSPAIGADGTVYIAAYNDKIFAFGVQGEGKVFKDPRIEPEEEYNEELIEPPKPKDEIRYEPCPDCGPEGGFEKRTAPKDLHQEPKDERSFFQKIIYWLKSLFS